ncbi:LRR repeats and ubiquitin-like domain-containing protein [Actinidia chinensis var. chinensis]|uniref:LRR repeats and ubiquitin-like domain-containing protein n=1 Tax=Actinidia chinensis var. chinensis TaxID=1590841 RepID=A0A2R6QJC2_ACTCC|nr:LRR repeats and ubiquitin-like domain-containing protein [Actinidia chinensis var. chinensis]
MEKKSENVINVNIKFSGRSIPVSPSSDSTVRDLKSLLQPLTNVLPRGQKLIFKGKVLVDESTLRSSEVSNGAKIMLVASQGLHQGDGPIRKEALATSNLRRMADTNRVKEKRNVTVGKSQFERWKATGVIALSECNLTAIPIEAWTVGPSARVLDLGHNSIKDVPATISSLCSMQKLLLNSNEILDGSISWEGLTSLKSLTVLSLNQNHLTSLPSALGDLTCLSQLYIANNELTCLPTEIGHLTQLQVLKANNNRICTLPASIGECTTLVEVDLSANLLVELPETFGNLEKLVALHLSNNGLKSLPSTLFKMCIQLSTLDLHGSEITMDLLRQFEGWEDFDKRRRLKHQKQLDFRVGGSAEFDEGADKSF